MAARSFVPSPSVHVDPLEVQTRRALRLLAAGWDTALAALLADDPRLARAVLRSAPTRRQAIRLAALHARRSGPPSPTVLPVLAEAQQVDLLLARLAQIVLTGHRAPLLSQDERSHVETARRRGTERLGALAADPSPPLEDAHRTCSLALLRACTGLGGDSRAHSPAARTCRDLTGYLVEITRLTERDG